MNITEFDEELRRRFGRHGVGARPFVCEGSPLDCAAIIVGANPATEGDFWTYWSTDSGFDKQSWQKDYERTRVAAGKRRRSNTRERLDRIGEAAAPVSCLETNVFATPSERFAELPGGNRRDSLLEFLVSSVQPAVILSHGVPARDAVRALNVGPHTVLLEVAHLTRVTYADATRLGRG